MGRICPQLNNTWCPVGTLECDNLRDLKRVCVLVRNAGNGAAGPIATLLMASGRYSPKDVQRAIQAWINSAYDTPLDLENPPFDVPTQFMGANDI